MHIFAELKVYAHRRLLNMKKSLDDSRKSLVLRAFGAVTTQRSPYKQSVYRFEGLRQAVPGASPPCRRAKHQLVGGEPQPAVLGEHGPWQSQTVAQAP